MNKENGNQLLQDSLDLLGKKGEEVAIRHILVLSTEELDAVKKAAMSSKNEIAQALVIKALKQLKKERAIRQNNLYGLWLCVDHDDEEEVKMFFKNSIKTEEDYQLLQEAFWQHTDGKKAFVHLLKSMVVPTPSKAIACIGIGAVTGGAVAMTTQLPTMGVVGFGFLGAVMADVIITGFEEDQATAAFGRALRRTVLDKPKSLWQSLTTKKEVNPQE